jgi:tetratricopeptide (TPR) repeat protein
VLTLLIAQEYCIAQGVDPSAYLLNDMDVQVEATQAVNDMYNFKFKDAEKQFLWIKQDFPWHPLPYFLMGLSQWWKMIPNLNVNEYDEEFLAYMDTSIFLADRLYKNDEENIEAIFFLAAAYGFKGRFLSERKSWRKAALAGADALKYMRMVEGNEQFSPEFLFGEALYNYYSVWVRENYPWLKPIFVFFKKGDKDLGIEQLKTVALNAFYTRTEAQYFLMRILSEENKDRKQAIQTSKYLHETFPGNAYFHRYYTRLLYYQGRFYEVEREALAILNNISDGADGYEEISGRYATFFLGQVYESRGQKDKAKKYYLQCVEFSEQIEAMEAGYYHYAMLGLAEIAMDNGDRSAAKDWVRKIKKYAKRGSSVHQKARELV